jgi:hypothetical protein
MEDAVPLTKYDMEKLKSEVFWDYQITKENLIKMARSDDLRERKHLFEKILFNSTELIMKLPGIFFLMKKNRWMGWHGRNFKLQRTLLPAR